MLKRIYYVHQCAFRLDRNEFDQVALILSAVEEPWFGTACFSLSLFFPCESDALFIYLFIWFNFDFRDQVWMHAISQKKYKIYNLNEFKKLCTFQYKWVHEHSFFSLQITDVRNVIVNYFSTVVPKYVINFLSFGVGLGSVRFSAEDFWVWKCYM